jgi:hypothetical protein
MICSLLGGAFASGCALYSSRWAYQKQTLTTGWCASQRRGPKTIMTTS